MSTQKVIPLDPDSPRGKQVAYGLTLLLEEFEEAIEERRRQGARSEPRSTRVA